MLWAYRSLRPPYREADGAKCLITFQLTHARDSQISICRIPVSNSHFIRNPLSLQVDRRNVLINCHRYVIWSACWVTDIRSRWRSSLPLDVMHRSKRRIASAGVRHRVVHGSIFIDPTQPNPYPTEPPYIEQLACRKKISLCTSCHHHPNAHRNNASTHSITSITVTLGLHATPTNFNWFNFLGWQSRPNVSNGVTNTGKSRSDFAHLPFQTHDPTQPTKHTNFRPIPDPSQPNPRVNPTHGQLWSVTLACRSKMHKDIISFSYRPRSAHHTSFWTQAPLHYWRSSYIRGLSWSFHLHAARPLDTDRSFAVAASRVWNSLPSTVTSPSSPSAFVRRLKTKLYN